MLIQADAIHLPYKSKTFHACVTSPPYWGLRKYAGEQGRVWGGDTECEHKWGELQGKQSRRKSDKELESNIKRAQERGYDVGAWGASEGAAKAFDRFSIPHSSFCIHCGAWFGGLGLEPTPELHIQNMVEVFREVRRVLRDDGVCWLNYGDCYAGGGRGQEHQQGPLQRGNRGTSNLSPGYRGIQQGSLMLMPHRLAIALQADGWIVRNDLVWFKRNPMPESVAGWRWERKRIKTGEGKATGDKFRNSGRFIEQDGAIDDEHYADPYVIPEYEYGDDYVLRKSSWRHTRSHEYVFMLVKKPKYYCNQEVVREIVAGPNTEHNKKYPRYSTGDGKSLEREGKPDYLNIGNDRGQGGRNPRSVLDVPTAPYKGAHYATFPPKLIAPLIRASVPRRCCPECGMAWAPVVEKGGLVGKDRGGNYKGDADKAQESGQRLNYGTPGLQYENAVTDYRPTCECGVTEHEPGIVLDIFGGSGTTGMVAKELMRRWVVMDISRPYLDEQAKVRTGTGTPSKALEGLPMFGGEDEAE